MKVLCKKNYVDIIEFTSMGGGDSVIVFEVGNLYKCEKKEHRWQIYFNEKSSYSFGGSALNEYFYTPEETRIEKLKNV